MPAYDNGASLLFINNYKQEALCLARQGAGLW